MDTDPRGSACRNDRRGLAVDTIDPMVRKNARRHPHRTRSLPVLLPCRDVPLNQSRGDGNHEFDSLFLQLEEGNQHMRSNPRILLQTGLHDPITKFYLNIPLAGHGSLEISASLVHQNSGYNLMLRLR